MIHYIEKNLFFRFTPVKIAVNGLLIIHKQIELVTACA